MAMHFNVKMAGVDNWALWGAFENFGSCLPVVSKILPQGGV